MSSKKLNCWEVKKCQNPMACPAFSGERGAFYLDKVHGGYNAGRACWSVAGTLSKDNQPIQCVFVLNYDRKGECLACDFYQLVKDEEGKNFESVQQLQNRMKAKF